MLTRASSTISLRRAGRFGIRTAAGFSLMELLVALVVSLIATTAMLTLMANTLGTGARTIEMTRLQQEMRAALQIISRELRRANFFPGAAEDCFANVDCGPDWIEVVQADGDCIQFSYQYDFNADGTDEVNISSFQRVARGGINVVQISQDGADACGDDWGATHDVTDPARVNVTALTIGDESYNEVIGEDSDSQTVNKLRLTLTAELISDSSGIAVSRTIEDLVYVRNHTLCPAGVCP